MHGAPHRSDIEILVRYYLNNIAIAGLFDAHTHRKRSLTPSQTMRVVGGWLVGWLFGSTSMASQWIYIFVLELGVQYRYRSEGVCVYLSAGELATIRIRQDPTHPDISPDAMYKVFLIHLPKTQLQTFGICAKATSSITLCLIWCQSFHATTLYICT